MESKKLKQEQASNLLEIQKFLQDFGITNAKQIYAKGRDMDSLCRAVNEAEDDKEIYSIFTYAIEDGVIDELEVSMEDNGFISVFAANNEYPTTIWIKNTIEEGLCIEVGSLDKEWLLDRTIQAKFTLKQVTSEGSVSLYIGQNNHTRISYGKDSKVYDAVVEYLKWEVKRNEIDSKEIAEYVKYFKSNA